MDENVINIVNSTAKTQISYRGAVPKVFRLNLLSIFRYWQQGSLIPFMFKNLM
jgi:hypothetical protein